MICNDDLCITYQIENLGCYKDFSNLGECGTVAKPPSERVAPHLVGFFKLRRIRFAAKPPSGRIALHSK